MKLVVVESPAKAKTIEKYLGKDYRVIASKGHIVDLPKSEIGIDIEKKFKPKYVIKNKIALAAIKKAYQDADGLILAVDPDREGEAIGWHVAKALKFIKPNGEIDEKLKNKLSRIVFTEITKDAITAAVNKPRLIDMNLVNAQQTRRILDRIVGYQLSPLLWKRLMFGLSAGRVQSVALRLVVEREKERDAFKPEEFWNIFAGLDVVKTNKLIELEIATDADEEYRESSLKQLDENIKFALHSRDNKKIVVKNRTESNAIIKNIRDGQWMVVDIDSKDAFRSPAPPFNTSTLQQVASNQIGMAASRTMRIAQQLYEQGLITYMRTDSLTLSHQAIESIRKLIKQSRGQEYLSSKPIVYKTKSKVAQEAHEAIRPSDITKLPESLKLTPEQSRLYELIWKRTMASQMANSKLELNTVKVKVNEYQFILEGQRVLFDGFNSLYKNKLKTVELPVFKLGQQIFPKLIVSLQKFSEPPARYSEATLIKALEANGIGRPSTYAPILTNITSKKYIEKEGKYLKPTLVGTALNNLLVDHFPKILDLKFTAVMEDDLDNIANGDRDYLEFLGSFYEKFHKSLVTAEKNIKKEDYLILGKSEEKCPICAKKMEIKLGRFSPFLSCVDFPKCKGMQSLNTSKTEEIDINAESFTSKYKQPPKTEDGKDYLLKKGRYGFFWAHPGYPKIKDAKPLEMQTAILKELFGVAPKAKDGKKMLLRNGKYGYYWAHPNYPKTKEVVKIDNKKLQEKKKELELF